MTDIFFYSVKVSFCLAVVYLFYKVALSRLTFYRANRWFLLLGSTLTLLIPFAGLFSLPLPLFREANHLPNSNGLLAWNNISFPLLENNRTNPFWQSYTVLLTILFWIGVIIFGIRLIIQIIAFYRIRHSASLLTDGKFKIYQLNKPIAPFSFGNHIFLNHHLLTPEEGRLVIEHEQVHARMKHSLDVLWIEILLMFTWYNPFAWLLKQATRENLEFIVDREVLLQDYSDKKDYQYLLLKIIGLSNVSIANSFNISSLKTRIHMMNRKPSNTGATGLYFLVLPVLIVLTFTFCNRTLVDNISPVKIEKGSVELTLPEDFVKGNTQINKVYLQPDATIVVVLKSGKNEKYDLFTETETSIFHERYGQVPLPPIPPRIIKPLGNNIFEVDYNTGKKETYNVNNKSEAEVFMKKFKSEAESFKERGVLIPLVSSEEK